MCCRSQRTFNDHVIGSPAALRVNALLDPSTDYVWELTDGFGNVYHQDFTTGTDGIGLIDMSILPAGFANPAQAPLQIRVKESQQSCDYVPLVIAQKFLQAVVSFKAGNIDKDWIACPFNAPAPNDRIYSDAYSDSYN